MTIGVVGRKCGMTRIFSDNGASIPVTVIEVAPNRITQIKTSATDGYCAVQVTCGARKPARVGKPQAGHFAKAGTEAGRGMWEFRLASESELDGLEPGRVIELDRFQAGQLVDVSGTSKGKGFAGVIKRWNFSMQDATHGNSLSHRAPGSIGQNQSPGRVFKGKKMAGHMHTHFEVPARNRLRSLWSPKRAGGQDTGRRLWAWSLLASPAFAAIAIVLGLNWSQSTELVANGITITAATYGANCGADRGNVTNDIGKSCNGHKQCSYTINVNQIGDPAPGCGKSYKVEYRCTMGPAMYSREVPGEAGLGSVVELSCPVPDSVSK